VLILLQQLVSVWVLLQCSTRLQPLTLPAAAARAARPEADRAGCGGATLTLPAGLLMGSRLPGAGSVPGSSAARSSWPWWPCSSTRRQLPRLAACWLPSG
jgi:hypothetical protein